MVVLFSVYVNIPVKFRGSKRNTKFSAGKVVMKSVIIFNGKMEGLRIIIWKTFQKEKDQK